MPFHNNIMMALALSQMGKKNRQPATTNTVEKEEPAPENISRQQRRALERARAKRERRK